MPKAKAKSKSSKSSASSAKRPTSGSTDPMIIVLDEAKQIGTDLMAIAKKAKQKFDKADDQTKKKILAGAAGALALLAAMHKAKTMGRKRAAKKRVM